MKVAQLLSLNVATMVRVLRVSTPARMEPSLPYSRILSSAISLEFLPSLQSMIVGQLPLNRVAASTLLMAAEPIQVLLIPAPSSYLINLSQSTIVAQFFLGVTSIQGAEAFSLPEMVP